MEMNWSVLSEHKCPHCGYENMRYWEEQIEPKTKCDNCGKIFAT